MARKLIWKAGGLVAVVLATFAVGNCFLPADKAFDRHMFGHDFLPFYTAGRILRSGRIDQLYDPVATRRLEHQTCAAAGLVIHNEYGAFLNPPFAAIPAASLAYWDYPTALWIWTAFLASFLVTAVVLLVRLLPARTPLSIWGLIPLLMFTALPVWQAALHAQNTFFSLLVLTAAVTLWRKDRPLAAGAVAGLLLFKPQVGVIVAIVMGISLGWQAVAGWSLTAIALLAINVIVLPGTLGDYVHRLPENLQAIQILPNYMWHRHVTFLAWWRILLQGHTGALPGEAARILARACTAAAALGLGVTVLLSRDPRQRDRLIAACIAAMPLLMPYYMDYDITLLAVAAVLGAAEAIAHGADRRALAGWAAFYIAMEANASISGQTRLIVAVPALAALAIVLCIKAMEPIAIARLARIPPPPVRRGRVGEGVRAVA